MVLGGGTRSTIASRISSIPMPFLALAGMASSRNGQNVFKLCVDLFEVGMRQIILLMTGMMVRSCFMARLRLAIVWASTP